MASLAKAFPADRNTRIRVLRLGLPVLAGLLIVVCVGQVAWRTLRGGALGTTAAGATLMTAPRFYGSHDGRNFVITGREGQRNAVGNGIQIADPVIEISQADQGTRRLTAKSGVYDSDVNKLTMAGDVRMVDAGGGQLASDRAVIDTQTGEVSGQTGLKASSGVGDVTSGSYDIRDHGGRVVFKGGVHARLPAH